MKKEGKERKGLSRQAKTNLVGYSFILPNIIGVCAFTLFPMVFSLIISFTDKCAGILYLYFCLYSLQDGICLSALRTGIIQKGLATGIL